MTQLIAYTPPKGFAYGRFIVRRRMFRCEIWEAGFDGISRNLMLNFTDKKLAHRVAQQLNRVQHDVTTRNLGIVREICDGAEIGDVIQAETLKHEGEPL